MHSLSKNNRWPYFLLILVTLGCYEPKDGCHDVLADNYDVSADNPCSDCCTYPDINIDINHLWKEKPFHFGDTITNDLLSQFVLLDQKVYLSNFTYYSPDGTEINTLDSITLTLEGMSITKDDDIVLVRKNQRSSTIERYKDETYLSKYRFTLGVTNDYDGIDTVLTGKIKNLSYEDNMNSGGKFASVWFKMIIGPTLQDTISIYLHDDVSINIDTNYIPLTNGNDVNVPLTIAYDSWFSGIDFTNDDLDQIEQKITKNTTSSFK